MRFEATHASFKKFWVQDSPEGDPASGNPAVYLNFYDAKEREIFRATYNARRDTPASSEKDVSFPWNGGPEKSHGDYVLTINREFIRIQASCPKL